MRAGKIDFQGRLITAALRWELARERAVLHDAPESAGLRYFRAAERLATAVRVYRRKRG